MQHLLYLSYLKKCLGGGQFDPPSLFRVKTSNFRYFQESFSRVCFEQNCFFIVRWGLRKLWQRFRFDKIISGRLSMDFFCLVFQPQIRISTLRCIEGVHRTCRHILNAFVLLISKIIEEAQRT